MEYCENCKCETPSIGVTIEKRGNISRRAHTAAFAVGLAQKLFFVVSYLSIIKEYVCVI